MHCVRKNNEKLVKFLIEVYNENSTTADRKLEHEIEKEEKQKQEERSKGSHKRGEHKRGRHVHKEVTEEKEEKEERGERGKLEQEEKEKRGKAKVKVSLEAVDSYGKNVIHHVVNPLPYGSYENIDLIQYLEAKGADIGIHYNYINNLIIVKLKMMWKVINNYFDLNET